MSVFDAGSIVGHLRLDMKGWTANVRRALVDARDLRQSIERNSQAAKQFATQLSVAGTAIQGVLGYAVKQAMDLQEAANLFAEVFGDQAERVRAWSEGISAQIRVSATDVRDYVSQLSLMFESMGLSSEAALELAQNLTKLTYDLASFRNLEVDEAFRKIASGMTGQVVPLREIGILVNETTVAQYAWAEGIAESGEQLNEIQKVLARYGVILQATAKDQGDMARTWDSATNLTKAFQVQIQSLITDIGTALLPAYSDMALRASQAVAGLQEFVEGHQELAAALVLGAAKIAAAAVGFGVLTLAIGQAAKAFKGLAAVVALTYALILSKPALIVAAILGIGAVIYSVAAVIRRNLMGIQDAMRTTADFIVRTWDAMGPPVIEVFRNIVGAYTRYLGVMYGITKTLVNQIIGWFHRSFVHLSTLIETWNPLTAWQKALTFETPDYLGELGASITNAAKGWSETVVDSLGQSWEGVQWLLPQIEGAVIDTAKQDFGTFLSWLKAEFPQAAQLAREFWDSIRGPGDGLSPFEGYAVPDFAKLMEGARLGAESGADSAKSAAETAAKEAADAYRRLVEQGEQAYLALNAVEGVLARTRETLEALKAAGRLDDDIRSLFAEEIWKGIENWSAAATENIIRRIGEIDAVLGQQLEAVKDRAVQTAADDLLKALQPEDIQLGQKMLEQIELLKKAGRWDLDTANLLAHAYWDRLEGLGTGAVNRIAEALGSPEFTDALEGVRREMAAQLGGDWLGELTGRTMQADAEAVLRDIVTYAEELKGQFQITDQEAGIFGVSFWQRFGAVGTEAIREIVAAIPDLPEALKKALEDVAAEQEKMAKAAKYDELAAQFANLGHAIGQLGPKFRTAAAAAQMASRIMAIAAAVAAGRWDLVAQEALMAVVEALGLIGDTTEEVKTGMARVLEEMANSVESWVDQMTDAIVEFAKTGKFEFKELVDSILSDMLRLTIKYGIMQPLFDAFGIKFADGGVVDRGNVVPFARGAVLRGGGVVDRPTIFPMRKGVGLMGEAGPEAILPLRRGRDGKLGVSLEGVGGGVTVQIVDQRGAGAPPVEVEETQAADGTRVIRAVIRDQVKQLVASGELDAVMGLNYGIRRQGR